MKIIYISGIDGCGKTTQSKKLVDELSAKGFNAQYLWLRWEPSFKQLIKKLRKSSVVPASPGGGVDVDVENKDESEWLKFKRKLMSNTLLRKLWLMYACSDYYAACRRRLEGVQTDLLVLDRYVDDFIIDQSVNLGLTPDRTDVIKKSGMMKNFHFPDYRVIIDLPASEGYRRKSDGTPLSYLETREKYYKAIGDRNTLHLNGMRGIDELADEIKGWVLKRLEEEGEGQ